MAELTDSSVVFAKDSSHCPLYTLLSHFTKKVPTDVSQPGSISVHKIGKDLDSLSIDMKLIARKFVRDCIGKINYVETLDEYKDKAVKDCPVGYVLRNVKSNDPNVVAQINVYYHTKVSGYLIGYTHNIELLGYYCINKAINHDLKLASNHVANNLVNPTPIQIESPKPCPIAPNTEVQLFGKIPVPQFMNALAERSKRVGKLVETAKAHSPHWDNNLADTFDLMEVSRLHFQPKPVTLTNPISVLPPVTFIEHIVENESKSIDSESRSNDIVINVNSEIVNNSLCDNPWGITESPRIPTPPPLPSSEDKHLRSAVRATNLAINRALRTTKRVIKAPPTYASVVKRSVPVELYLRDIVRTLHSDNGDDSDGDIDELRDDIELNPYRKEVKTRARELRLRLKKNIVRVVKEKNL
jgi:hypothetical protein